MYIKGTVNVLADGVSRLPLEAWDEVVAPREDEIFDLKDTYLFQAATGGSDCNREAVSGLTLAQRTAAAVYDVRMFAAPCKVCGESCEDALLCDKCDGAFHL